MWLGFGVCPVVYTTVEEKLRLGEGGRGEWNRDRCMCQVQEQMFRGFG